MSDPQQFKEGILVETYQAPVFVYANKCIYFVGASIGFSSRDGSQFTLISPKEEVVMRSTLRSRAKDFALS